MRLAANGSGRSWVVLGVAGVVAFGLEHVPAARADAFNGYALQARVSLPDGAGPFDVLSDGRLVTLVGADLYVETSVGSRGFTFYDTLPDADLPSYGAAFLRVSPDGGKIAIGNNGGASFGAAVERAIAADRFTADDSLPRLESRSVQPVFILVSRDGKRIAVEAKEVAAAGVFEVGVFNFNDLSGNWFGVSHFDAEWIDDTHLALTAGDFITPSVVTALDTGSADPSNPTNPTIIDNIGGASGGITFDKDGNLYTGNGFATSGPSGTGAVKVFGNAAWTTAWSGGTALDFEADGTLVVDVLSASPLGFDAEGNLLVGGGDFFGSGEGDFAAVVRASAVTDAINDLGPADPSDPDQLRRLDPDTTNDFNFYSINYNPVTGELYLHDGKVYAYRDLEGIPTLSQWGIAVTALVLVTAGTLIIRRQSVIHTAGVGK